MTREEKIMKRVKEHYEEACSLGFEVVAIFLQGSQNYNCDEYSEDYQSDIDTKCIILPSLVSFDISNPSAKTFKYATSSYKYFICTPLFLFLYKLKARTSLLLRYTSFLYIKN